MFGMARCMAERTRSGTTDGPGIATSSRPALRLSSIGRVWHDVAAPFGALLAERNDQQVGAPMAGSAGGAAVSSVFATRARMRPMSGCEGLMTGGTRTRVRALD